MISYYDAFLTTAEREALGVRYVMVAAPPEVEGQEPPLFEVEIRMVEIGQLAINGPLYACDVLMMTDLADESPLTATFPTGRFPVELAVACFDGDERNALARIRFSDAPVERFELAERADGTDRYGTDTATGAFFDAAAGREYAAYIAADAGNYGRLLHQMHATGPTGNWLLWEHNGHTVAIFACGGGEINYETHIGYDAQDNVCQLITDFEMPVEDFDELESWYGDDEGEDEAADAKPA